MEVKGHVISVPDVQCVSQPRGNHRVERMTVLQERRHSLQTLLNARLAELRRVCLQEAELTGEVPVDFPLEAGERRPYVRRRVTSYRQGPKNAIKTETEEVFHRKPKKTLFSSALRRHVDPEQHHTHSKRTVHRGCHTDDTVHSESSSMSDSTGGHENDESSGGATDSLSPSRPRLALGHGTGSNSPEQRLCRKLSPIEVYYEIRTTARRNSLANSASPSRTLPRSISNVEGRSVPATPLLARNGHASVHNHIRSDISISGASTRQHSDPEAPQLVPLQSEEGPPTGPLKGSSSGPSSGSYEGGGGGVYSTQRRSNSSEALLDRTNSCNEGGQIRGGHGERSGCMPSRGGPPYKSSDALTDGRLRQVNGQRSSPERQLVNGHGPEQARLGGQATRPGGYSEVLMDYVWGKQQQRQAQHVQGKFPSSAPGRPQGHLSGGPPAYSSPLVLRGKPGDPRKVKVTRTKSCGPCIPLQPHQQEALLFSASTSSDPPAPPTSSTAALYPLHGSEPHQSGSGPKLNQNQKLGSPQLSDTASPDEPTRSLHKALALEGLRAWYLRNTLTGPGGQESGAPPRRRTTNSLHGSHPHQPLNHKGGRDRDYPPCQLPQSHTFHGHPLHGRSIDLSSYQESFQVQRKELTLKEPSTDLPSPGTLV
ncbi:hypothetical protein UPYG_G00001350 [Umbra pygmaea]|uniref:Cytohesin Ubiquitin Protein Inducing domain-containing protein n=1 Tax=Umbra pygmaea TaxID=75934 RepID=A0ABD0XIZ6_UMBPY